MITLNNRYQHFSGVTEYYQHESSVNQSLMRFSVFLPPQIEQKQLPVLYWLSGLTCTEENFMIKAGAQRMAAQLGLVLVCMDTSPRNLGIAGEDDSYDFGSGAGFYVNATQPLWQKHYNMYDYVTLELPTLIEQHFNVNHKKSLCGHSMGGHGALMIALKNPDKYQSVSAFSPIVAPSQCAWGQKAFSGYLGNDQNTWKAYDTCELIKTAQHKMPLLVEYGEADEFLTEQLKPELLKAVCEQHDHPLTLNTHAGYDHSYYFIASFIEAHLRHHMRHLS